MRCSIASFGWAAVIVLGLAASASSANAQSVMKVCGDQWKAAKAAGTTNGETWPQFLAQCRAQQSGGAAPAPSTYAPTVSPAQAPAAGGGMTTSQCDAEYSANKAAIKASGQTKKAFVAACRAGNATIPQGTAAAPPPPPAPASAPTGSLFPWQQPTAAQPAPAPAPAPANYGSAPAPTGAGEFATEQQARYRCPSGTIVWVNTKSRIYHFAGTSNYGNTKHGAYMCEQDAQAAGDRAAMNEHHR